MIIRKNIKLRLNFPIQMFPAIVRYTCNQFESFVRELLTLITNPVSDFCCNKRNMFKDQLLAF
jgi:hypothetical protein